MAMPFSLSLSKGEQDWGDSPLRYGIVRSTLKSILGAAAVGILFFPSNSLLQNRLLEVGHFSVSASKTSSDEWKPLIFRNIDRHTEYSLVVEDGRNVVKAVSEGSASGLIRRIQIDPKEYPLVRWSWKIENILQKGNVYRKKGDDYPARLYITFQFDPERLGFFTRVKYEFIKSWYGEYPPLAALNYIWASTAPRETMVPNPFTDRVIMIVVESGEEKVGQWVEEKRNIYEDYRRAFGEDPPFISGVAIMTDTDNTGESAVAYYGDIILERGPGK